VPFELVDELNVKGNQFVYCVMMITISEVTNVLDDSIPKGVTIRSVIIITEKSTMVRSAQRHVQLGLIEGLKTVCCLALRPLFSTL
jgi:hypothetical protein